MGGAISDSIVALGCWASGYLLGWLRWGRGKGTRRGSNAQ